MSELPGRDNKPDGAVQRPDPPLPWRDQIDEMRKTRRKQFLRVSRKMLNHLCAIGLSSAQKMSSRTCCCWSPAEAKTWLNAAVSFSVGFRVRQRM